MMGSGKSTVGRLLAERLEWPYHDNDLLLVNGEGQTARQLLAARGDAGLLAAEVGALRRALALPVPNIVGVAARAILDPQTREALRDAGLVAWLRVTPETVRQRAVGAAHRPWPADDPLPWLRAAVRERDPLYASVADLALDADAHAPELLGDAIAAAVTDRGCGPDD